MSAKRPFHLITLPIPTNAGPFLAHYSTAGLAHLDFPRATPSSSSADTPKSRGEHGALCRRWRQQTIRAVRNILAGRPPGPLPPLDLAGATPFQKTVWAALRKIPRGTTRTYATLAAQIGRPKAARAVGKACGANPIPLLIPCHRVLAAGGKLGGFSAGLAWKRRLLDRELALTRLSQQFAEILHFSVGAYEPSITPATVSS